MKRNDFFGLPGGLEIKKGREKGKNSKAERLTKRRRM